VSLPDASGLARLVASDWRALADRLRTIGVTPAHAAEALRVGPASGALPRQPLRLWHLRRRDDAAAVALRLLFLRDTVDGDAAARALGATLEPCLAAGLLMQTADGISCPFELAFAEELLLLCDQLERGGDAIMGPAATTAELARIARPLSQRSSLLDLGCGAGTLALLFSAHARRTVGTDVNARALHFARVNAALNGHEEIEWRTGDLFAPVANEAFELVVAQPPFVPQPPGAPNAAYLHGGARGDELALRLLAGLPARLVQGGRGVLLAMWPEVAGEGLAARVVRALGAEGLGVTIFQGPRFELDDWCTSCAAREHPTLGADFDASVIALREHLGGLNVQGFCLAAIVVERTLDTCSWATTLPGVALALLDSTHVEAALRSQRLAAGPDSRLLAARLVAPAGAVFLRDAPNRVLARYAADSPWPTLTFDDLTYAVAATLAAAPSVRAAVATIHAKFGAAEAEILGAVRQALVRGVVAPE
jgi:methylase of polypeptide subunit release factors